MLADAWRVPWENAFKETLWRLTVDGRALYGSPRYDSWRASPGLCLCGLGVAGRHHAFWACPLARAVRAALEAELAPEQRPLTRCHLWLLQAPLHVHGGVWRVVALAALTAIDRSLSRLTRVCMPDRPPDAGSDAGTDSDSEADSGGDDNSPAAGTPQRPRSRRAPTDAELQHAAAAAVTDLWDAVEDFATLHAAAGPPACWRGRTVPANHPFIHVTPAKRLEVSVRSPAAAPDAVAEAVLAWAKAARARRAEAAATPRA